jgi:undecaprenyl-diphosphatase
MIDYFIFQKINSLAGKSVCIDSLGIFFAEYLGYFLVAILFLFLLKNSKKYRPMAVKGLISAFFSRFGIIELIRFFWDRSRPFVENNVNLLLNHPVTSSFPSGHAAFYFGLSTIVYFYNKKLGILFLISSSLISISRVFVGVHWPSDILAGAIVGIFSGWLVMKISDKFKLSR